MKPRLIIEQKITPLVNQYRIYAVLDDGSKGELVGFAQQKRLTLKEEVTFYHDEQKTSPAFSFKAEKALDIHGRYFVKDVHGKHIGTFKKHFKKSLINSTWQILDNAGKPVFTVSESNKVYAVIRRVVAFIPVVDDIAEVIGAFIKYHFSFVDNATGQEVGKYRKTKMVRDHYELSMTDEAYNSQDWRVFACIGVALDALQDR